MVSFSYLIYCSCIYQGREVNPSLYIELGGKPTPGTSVADKEGLPIDAAARLIVIVLSAQAQPHCNVRTAVQPRKSLPCRHPGLRSQIRILIGGRKTRRKISENFRLDPESNLGRTMCYLQTICEKIKYFEIGK